MADPYISEVKYLGGATHDFIEVAVDEGTDVTDLVVTIYNPDGTVRSTNSLDGLSYTTINGQDIYVIESGSPSTFNGLHKHGGLSLSDSSTVYSFISFSDNSATITATEGAASGLTSTDVGMAGSGQSLESTDGGASYDLQTNPTKGTIPCLTNGTRVQTDQGEVMVEDLEPGMCLLTIDGDFAPLRKVFSRLVSGKEIRENNKFAPVRIKAGALGCGLPKDDLLVSRQHRMLVSSIIAERMFEETSVLVAAIRLTALPGIFVDTDVADITYYHLLLDRHRVIFAENAPTESLFIGEYINSSLPAEVVEEICALFPLFAKDGFVPKPARYIPDGKRQRQLMKRHAKNGRAPLSQFPISRYEQLVA